MHTVQEQPANSNSEYKDLRDKVDELVEKSTAQNFSIRKRVKITIRLNPKEPPISTVALMDMIRMDAPSSTATQIALAVNSPTSA